MHKLVHVSVISVYCFLFSLLVSSILDKFTLKADDTKATWKIFLEVLYQFALIGLCVFAGRGLYGGFKELKTLPLLVFIFMFFQTKTRKKMEILNARLEARI